MIRLEYDPPTAGTRVSFVVRDSEEGVSVNSFALLLRGRNAGPGIWTVPQNNETLDVVKSLLEHVREGVE
jgi:hypothetical protein